MSIHLLKNAHDKYFGSRCDDTHLIKYYTESDFKDLKHKPIEFKSNKGQILRGQAYFYDNFDHQNLIIFCHGMGGGHLSYMKEIHLIAKSGKMVIAYDNTGTFMSDGKSIVGFCQSLVDLDYCIQYLRSSEEYQNYSLSLIGHSWGGYAVANILNYQDHIKNAIILSAPISYKQVLMDQFKGIKKVLVPLMLNLERKEYNNYVDSSSLDSLKDTQTNVLVIHSENDNEVLYKSTFLKLKNKIHNVNVHFLSVKRKYHNPNYTEDAVCYLRSIFSGYKKLEEKKRFTCFEDRKRYFDSVDWTRASAQDMTIFNLILKNLK